MYLSIYMVCSHCMERTCRCTFQWMRVFCTLANMVHSLRCGCALLSLSLSVPFLSMCSWTLCIFSFILRGLFFDLIIFPCFPLHVFFTCLLFSSIFNLDCQFFTWVCTVLKFQQLSVETHQVTILQLNQKQQKKGSKKKIQGLECSERTCRSVRAKE